MLSADLALVLLTLGHWLSRHYGTIAVLLQLAGVFAAFACFVLGVYLAFW